jgi:MFS family permease
VCLLHAAFLCEINISLYSRMNTFIKDKQYFKFCFYGFLKNLRFFDAFFILFLLEKGMSFTQIGILYAAREIFTNIFEIPSGIFADAYGRKSSLIASFFAYIISFYIFYISSGFGLFMAAFLLYGVGDAFRSGTHKSMIMDYLNRKDLSTHKINYYGHTRSWSQKGSAISSLIAGLIIFSNGSYENIFLYSIIPYVLNLVLIFSYPKELNRSITKDKKCSVVKLTVLSFFRIIKQVKVLKIINTSAIHSAYLKAVKDYIQPLMLSIALITPILLKVEVEKKNGIIIGVIYFIIYLITSQASKLSAKVAAKNKRTISYITLVLGFTFGVISGVFYVYDLWILSIIAFIGIYVVENIRKPILTSFVADNVPNEILTSVISAQSLWKTLITAILAFSFGIIADSYGIGNAFILVSGFLLLSTSVLSFYAKGRSQFK